MIASTAEPCAIFDNAIIGHKLVEPKSAINCISMAFVIWCNPVITSGAYKKPNNALNNQLIDEVNPVFTIDEIQLPIAQPTGPNTTLAAITVGNSENSGTKIIEIDCGIYLRKKISK